MSEYNHPQCDEKFLKEPSKVNEALEVLDIMSASVNRSEDLKAKTKEPKPVIDYSSKVTDTNYFVNDRPHHTRMSRRSRMKALGSNMNQMVFMRQIDQTLEQRSKTRLERVKTANCFRRMGNYEYRRGNYETAIAMYNHGLDYIKDTYVLYLNRCACFIKIRQFKNALLDCDYILNRLDSRNIRAWLYKAVAFKRQGEETNYDYCLYQAKLLNPAKLEFVDDFLERMRSAV